MKKIILMVLVVLFAASSAMATDYVNYGSGTTITGPRLVCGAGVVATDKLEIGVSPKVAALYRTLGSANPQWYLIATVHIGGTEAYATAQDLTKIYKKTYAAGTAIGTAFGGLATVQASEGAWVGWSY